LFQDTPTTQPPPAAAVVGVAALVVGVAAAVVGVAAAVVGAAAAVVGLAAAAVVGGLVLAVFASLPHADITNAVPTTIDAIRRMFFMELPL
jgi:hypothetical protein